MDRTQKILAIAVLLIAFVFFLGIWSCETSAATIYSSQEIQFVNMLNEYRQEHGLQPLLVSDILSDSSLKHSSDMAKYEFFNHYTVAQSDYYNVGTSPISRMVMSGYNNNVYWGENIAAGYNTTEEVFAAWKASPDHNVNMLNANYTVVGIGIAYNPNSLFGYYWTTDFGSFVDATAHDINTTTTTTESTTTTTTLPSQTQRFSDIPNTYYAYEAIQYCAESGYLKGYEDGSFKPNNNILIGHIHKILGDGIKTNYWDKATRRYVSDWLEVPLFGYANKSLGLDGLVTRSQVALLLYSRDMQLREPSPSDTLIGYLDKSTSEILYLNKYATGARLTCTINQLVYYYNYWAPKFGIRADFALAQAIKETAHFEYGGIVNWTDNNFCGLGGGPNETLAKFATAQLGVIAHLAHLACYAYPRDIISQCSEQFDPKHNHEIYKMLNPNGGNTTWLQLNGVWAVPGTTYAQDIARIAARF